MFTKEFSKAWIFEAFLNDKKEAAKYKTIGISKPVLLKINFFYEIKLNAQSVKAVRTRTLKTVILGIGYFSSEPP